MSNANNIKVFRLGMEKFRNELMKPQLIGALIDCGKTLLFYAASERTFHSLTGNTLTSFMVGIYDGSRLDSTLSIMDVTDIAPPTRRKISKGKGWSTEFIDYDSGRKVVVNKEKMAIVTDEGYGRDTSLQFLRSYQASPKGFTLVFTTGTEYSAYLMNERNLNVIQESMTDLEMGLFLKSLKPI